MENSLINAIIVHLMASHFKWLLPLLVMGIFTPFSPMIDNKVAAFFYTPAQMSSGHFFDCGFTHFLYLYGEQIGRASGVVALIVYLLSWPITKILKWRGAMLVCGLTLALGTGLLTNLVLKEYWGRPRPKQVVEYGGKHTFRPYYHPDFHTRHDPQKSFPSGHVSMGFYYLSLCLTGRRYRSRLLFLMGLFLTAFFGGGLMFARVAQGGHFLSDVLMAGLIMWWTALFCDWLVFTRGVFGVLGGPDPIRPGTSPEPDQHQTV